MTKKEQIKEMADLLFDYAENYCDVDGHIITNKLAETLYEAGYRKIGDDEIVVNKYEYADLKTFSDCAIFEHKEIANARKEMAKEIISYLGTIKEDDGTPFKDYLWYKFLCKKYGVEVEQ